MRPPKFKDVAMNHKKAEEEASYVRRVDVFVEFEMCFVIAL